MRTFVLALALAASAFLGAALTSDPASAQKGAKNSCPGGLPACIQRCTKSGGQPRNCPRFCQKNHGC